MYILIQFYYYLHYYLVIKLNVKYLYNNLTGEYRIHELEGCDKQYLYNYKLVTLLANC